MATPDPVVAHLHTYFLFPFAIDMAQVENARPHLWPKQTSWLNGVDKLVGSEGPPSCLGRWKRAPYTRFDVNSPAYHDMVFFHSFVRRIFFDAEGMRDQWEEHQSLLRCFTLPVEGRRVTFGAEARGKSVEVNVEDLRLFLFANGIGILSIGIEAADISAAQALWINEMMRKVYPSSGRQQREGRTPQRIWLSLDGHPVVEEARTTAELKDFLPPLSRVITSLLSFLDYERGDYEPVLDERMIVYTYVSLEPATLPAGFIESEAFSVLLSRILYVDHFSPAYRYDRRFIRRRMREQLYTRWAHQGTYYGFTSYSNVTTTFGRFDCDDHLLEEGFLVHRMFNGRYYLMAIIALFYRASLLDFAERTALVSKRIYQDYSDARVEPQSHEIAARLRAEFMHFSNYWHFEELANKDEEIEHFALQCREFRIAPMMAEIAEEIESLNVSLNEYYQRRNMEAVNRLGLLSMIFGAGAVATGFFGMNFARSFGSTFFEPEKATAAHWAAIIGVSIVVVISMLFGVYLLAVHWEDYRQIARPNRKAPLASHRE